MRHEFELARLKAENARLKTENKRLKGALEAALCVGEEVVVRAEAVADELKKLFPEQR